MQILDDFELERVRNRLLFLQSSFELSSRKDQLVGIVRESLEGRLWSSCVSELGSWSDETKFQALDVLIKIIHPGNQVSVTFFQLNPAEALVPQYETFSSANQDFLMRLKTLCDSVIHTYLAKIADTAEKRSYLHVLYTAVDCASWVVGPSLEVFPDYAISQILALNPPAFQPCGNPNVLLNWRATNPWTGQHSQCRANYIRDFLWNPERSRLFHYDPGQWNAVVVARFVKYLRTSPSYPNS